MFFAYRPTSCQYIWSSSQDFIHSGEMQQVNMSLGVMKRHNEQTAGSGNAAKRNAGNPLPSSRVSPYCGHAFRRFEMPWHFKTCCQVLPSLATHESNMQRKSAVCIEDVCLIQKAVHESFSMLLRPHPTFKSWK